MADPFDAANLPPLPDEDTEAWRRRMLGAPQAPAPSPQEVRRRLEDSELSAVSAEREQDNALLFMAENPGAIDALLQPGVGVDENGELVPPQLPAAPAHPAYNQQSPLDIQTFDSPERPQGGGFNAVRGTVDPLFPVAGENQFGQAAVLGGAAQEVATGGAPAPASPRSAGGGQRSAGMADQLAQMLRENASPERINDLVQQLADSMRYEGALLEQTGVDNAADIYAAAQQQQAIHDQQTERFSEDLRQQEEMLQDIDAQIQQLRHERFDANRLFRDRGLGTSLALGVAVGAANSFMANALFPGTNTTNTSMQILNDAIDRDLREQMVQRQDSITNIGMQRTAFQQFRELSGDNQTAFNLAKAKSEMWAAQQLRARAMNTAGQTSRQQLERQALDMELQAAQREQAALDSMAQAMMQRRGGGGAGRPPKPPKAGEADMTGAGFASMTRYADGVRPDDLRVRLTESQRNTIWETANSGSAMIRTLDRMRDIINATTRTERAMPRAQAYEELRHLRAVITGLVKENLALGALDSGVQTLVDQMVPNATDVTANTEAALQIYRSIRAETITKTKEVVERGSGNSFIFDPNWREPSSTQGAPPGVHRTPDPELQPLSDATAAFLRSATSGSTGAQVLEHGVMRGLVPGGSSAFSGLHGADRAIRGVDE